MQKQRCPQQVDYTLIGAGRVMMSVAGDRAARVDVSKPRSWAAGVLSHRTDVQRSSKTETRQRRTGRVMSLPAASRPGGPAPSGGDGDEPWPFLLRHGGPERSQSSRFVPATARTGHRPSSGERPAAPPHRRPQVTEPSHHPGKHDRAGAIQERAEYLAHPPPCEGDPRSTVLPHALGEVQDAEAHVPAATGHSAWDELRDRVRLCDRESFTGPHYRLDAAPSLPRPRQRPHPPIHVGGAGERRTLPLVARHADVWNCPTYALAELPWKLDVLRAECARLGRDPASLRVTEEAVLALVPRADQVEEARALALRRFAGPGWGVEAGGWCGTPDAILRRVEERARLGVTGFVFFLHDRATPETIRLLAREVVAA